MLRHVSAGEICQVYIQKRPLHRSLQESTKFTALSFSHPMASYTSHISTFDRLDLDPSSSDDHRIVSHLLNSSRHCDEFFPRFNRKTASQINGSNKSAQLVNPDLLYRLDGLFAFYHRQWWYHRQMFYHFKWRQSCLKALALIIVAIGIVVGSVLKNTTLIA